MNHRALIPLITLLPAAALVSAQPPAFIAPPPIAPGYATAPMPYGPGIPPQPMMPKMLYPAPGLAPRTEPTTPSQPVPAARIEMPGRTLAGPASEASATLKAGIEKLMAYLSQEEIPNRLQVAAFLDREIAPYFDFDYMARWVSGPAYDKMSAEDKRALAAHIEADFLSTLTAQLAQYDGQRMRLSPPRLGPRGSVSVNVAILSPGNYPATLEFRMYQAEQGWRIYDVLANGRSAAAYYRGQLQRVAAAERAGGK